VSQTLYIDPSVNNVNDKFKVSFPLPKMSRKIIY